MASVAHTGFEDLIANVDQLITIHGKLQEGKGRRHEQDSLHRAGVVMSIAAWESYIEKIVMESLDSLERSAGLVTPTSSPPVPAWARHAFALRRAEIARSVKKFNTPNDVAVRDVFKDSIEFEPWQHWNWHAGPRQWDSKKMRETLNDWVLIRHSVAHGFPLPTNISFIQDSNGKPRLTLSLLKECKNFTVHLVAQTDAALSDFLHSHHGIPKPW